MFSVYPYFFLSLALVALRAFGPFTFSWFWCPAPLVLYIVAVIVVTLVFFYFCGDDK